MDRRTFIGTGALAFLSACARKTDNRLKLSTVALDAQLDPYASISLDSADLSWLFADGLIGADLRDPAKGSLSAHAPIGQPSARARSFRYELRPALRWHDGRPLQAQDVVDCFERVQRSPVGRLRPYRLVEKIAVHDPLSFTVHLSEPDPSFPMTFFGPLGSPGVPLVRTGHMPIGTGPFRISEHRPEGTTFERWTGSPRGTPRVPSAFLAYLANTNTQDVMLQTGETDIALGADPMFVLDRKIPHLRRTAGVGYMLLNTASVAPDIRRAAAQAVDRREIIDKAYRHWAQPLHSILPTGAPGANVAETWTFNPDAARQVFSKHSGLELTIATAAGNAERIALLVQAQLRKAGAETTIRHYAPIEYFAPKGPLRTGQFDIAFSGDVSSLDPDLLATWGCAARPPSGNNFARLCDPAFDDLLRHGEMEQAMHRFWADTAVIPLAGYVWCIALGSRVRGVHQISPLAPSVYTSPDWYVV
ncbi:MAG: ABC transporter substrate-binding protein [Vulcanimicrobiaceae bacterium]